LMWLALGQCILRGREQCFPLHSIACMTKLLALTLGALLTTTHMPSLGAMAGTSPMALVTKGSLYLSRSRLAPTLMAAWHMFATPLPQVGLPPLVLFLRLPCQLHHPRCRRLLHLLHLLHFLLYRSLH
jgi:hypothetical protein